MESMNDIIAELHSVAFSMKVHDAMMPEVYDILCGVAFRLESAWKREKSDAESDALAVGGIVEAARTTEKSSALGNAAAMREALVKLREIANVAFEKKRREGVETVNLPQAIWYWCGKALAAPPRQCDVGTAEEQAERKMEFCYKQGGCGNCSFNKSATLTQCAFAWAQTPYEEGGAK